uniref:Peptidase C39 domain-containing protein n=1 Tax=Hydrogenovibrio crunogenus (strain DSM 25203 / XCL-2) TaxID=317025 RepID=Q31GJ0_HYDCU
MLNPVIQEEKTGCGIAASAAIAGLTYSQAKKAANQLGIDAADKTLWSNTTAVQRLLMALGKKVAEKTVPFTDWEALPDCALLAIKWHLEQGKPFWHWVVFVREGTQTYVLDSKQGLKTPVRTDFGRMHPKWFLAVSSD